MPLSIRKIKSGSILFLSIIFGVFLLILLYINYQYIINMDYTSDKEIIISSIDEIVDINSQQNSDNINFSQLHTSFLNIKLKNFRIFEKIEFYQKNKKVFDFVSDSKSNLNSEIIERSYKNYKILIYINKNYLQNIQFFYMGLFLLFMILYILCIYYFNSKHISPLVKSIESLHKFVQKFRGNFEYVPHEFEIDDKSTPQEIIFLGKSFSEMVEEFYAYTQALEDKNIELTKKSTELEITNKKLIDKNYYFSKQLSKIAEAYDDDTGRHIERVAELSYFIAVKYGLDDSFTNAIRYFAPLHDIGKLMVPKEIINKNGRLTPEEFNIIKQHTTDGAVLIGEDEEFTIAKNIAKSHHEKYSGFGYPEKLKGDEIPIEAQIVSFADIYDALRSKRAYKAGYSSEETFKIITEGDLRLSPDDFNPKILEIYKEYYKEFDEIYINNY